MSKNPTIAVMAARIIALESTTDQVREMIGYQAGVRQIQEKMLFEILSRLDALEARKPGMIVHLKRIK